MRTTKKPTLVLMAGMPGAGKSTLALALGASLGWPVLDKDTFKTTLLETGVLEAAAGPLSYQLPLDLCSEFIARQNLSVIFDSPAAYPSVIERARQIVSEETGQLRVIYCQADSSLRNERLRSREQRLSQTQADPSTDAQNRLRFAHLPTDCLTLPMERPLLELLAEALAYLTSKTTLPRV